MLLSIRRSVLTVLYTKAIEINLLIPQRPQATVTKEKPRLVDDGNEDSNRSAVSLLPFRF